MNAEAFCYSRLANPTTDVLEKRIAALEGGIGALATASIQAALFITIMSLANAGSNIIVASSISDSSALQFKARLPNMNITARHVEDGDLSRIQELIDENTKAVYIESVSTQDLRVSDIAAIAAVAHQAGIPLVVDNTAGAGGFLIRPIDHGADIVISSTAEWLSISGSTTGGLITDSGNFDWDSHKSRFPQFTDPSPGFHGLNIWKKFGKLSFIVLARIAVMRDIGPCTNPFASSELLLGLETLSVRIERSCVSALKLALWLQNHERVVKVSYSGLTSHPDHVSASKYMPRGYGGLLSFSVQDDQFLNQRLKVVTTSGSVGGSKTSVILQTPAVYQDFHFEHKERGQAAGQAPVFVSVGLEHINDIIADFEQAFR
ncbi:O-acetylhomoserine aminocarboxypropyltransferase/cysteine synthase [Phlyctema vagabunda]|uniref:O-acetylhomoserine aminocarboxypropyltransferase/cysteine synthase n=1 Tax=Phlyctema vagabunda TaxID=108571 RepID=A0ABR4P3J0_9HELO